MSLDNPVVARGVNHWFGRGEARKQALFDVDLIITRGSFTALVGPSGSGKTTLLTLVGCLREVQDGSIQLFGHELRGASAALLIALRRRIGFIFQAHNLHESLTALENVRMGLQVHGRIQGKPEIDAATHALTLFGLEDRTDYFPANLSGGQKQRVAVARALVGNPDLILADEPTAALDRDSGMRVVDILRRLGEARGTTTIMVTHDSRILDRADRIITLEDGRIVADTAQPSREPSAQSSSPA
jgi:putative ABC transport system ATP-binding protein